MTETKILPPCPHCGDTGFVPPFMDACACGVEAGPTVTFRGVEVPTVAKSPAASVPADLVGMLDPHVEEWLTAPGLAPDQAKLHKAKEAARKYEAALTAAVTMVMSGEGHPQHLLDELEAAGIDYEPDEFMDEVDIRVKALGSITNDDLGPKFVEINEAGRVSIEPAPKTSKDTFAALEAACEAIVPPGAVARSTKYTKPASEPQMKLLASLVAERPATNTVVAQVVTEMAAGLTAKRASSLITTLMAVPKDPTKASTKPNFYDGICAGCKGPVPAKTGRVEKIDGKWTTFHLTGGCLTTEEAAKLAAERITEPGLYKYVAETGETAIYRVRPSRSSKRLYGELIIPLPDGSVNFSYNAKAMSFLRSSDKLTWKEARDFGAAYGACVACGRTLSDSRSLVQGYGPTCANHYHWPTVTAKQAEAIIEGIVTWEEVVGLAIV